MMTNKGIDFYIKEMNESKKSPLFKALQKIDIEIMDEFSAWLANEKYILSHLTGLWRKNIMEEEKPKKMSEMYQMFLKSKQA